MTEKQVSAEAFKIAAMILGPSGMQLANNVHKEEVPKVIQNYLNLASEIEPHILISDQS